MVFILPLVIWLGILTFTLLIITLILGLLSYKGKASIKVHRIFALLTIISAITHFIIAVLFYFYGIVI